MGSDKSFALDNDPFSWNPSPSSSSTSRSPCPPTSFSRWHPEYVPLSDHGADAIDNL